MTDYGFTEPDLQNLRFYLDIMNKSPLNLAEEAKASARSRKEAKVFEICYSCLQAGPMVSIVEMLKSLRDLAGIGA